MLGYLILEPNITALTQRAVYSTTWWQWEQTQLLLTVHYKLSVLRQFNLHYDLRKGFSVLARAGDWWGWYGILAYFCAMESALNYVTQKERDILGKKCGTSRKKFELARFSLVPRTSFVSQMCTAGHVGGSLASGLFSA